MIRFLLIAISLLALFAPASSAATVSLRGEINPYTLDSVAANNTNLIDAECLNMRELQVQLTGTWTATVSFQGSNDNVDYVSLAAYPSTGGAVVTSTSSVGAFLVPCTTRFVRVRVTAYTSGTVTGSAVFSSRQTDVELGTVALGSNQTVNVAQMNGVNVTMGNGTSGTGVQRVAIASDNTWIATTSFAKAEDAASAAGDGGVFNLAVRRDAATSSASAAGDYQEMTANRFGALYTAGFRTHTRTYSATHNITVAASATDIALLPGNATTTVQVTKVRISGIQTTSGTPEVLLIVRSTANSGGTSTSFSVGRHEQADSANSSTPIGYTANPTPGTSAGTIRRQYLPVGAAASGLSGEVVFELGENGKPIVLSGTAQGLAINLNGATVTGGVFNISIEWIEF